MTATITIWSSSGYPRRGAQTSGHITAPRPCLCGSGSSRVSQGIAGRRQQTWATDQRPEVGRCFSGLETLKDARRRDVLNFLTSRRPLQPTSCPNDAGTHVVITSMEGGHRRCTYSHSSSVYIDGVSLPSELPSIRAEIEASRDLRCRQTVAPAFPTGRLACQA
jgi:hypothetical protein